MTLDPVVVGQPHTDAHNAERAKINQLDTSSTLASVRLDVERQFARQYSDRRALPPVAPEPVYSTSGTIDGTLKKSVLFPTSGLSEGQQRAMTQTEVDAFPIDLGPSASEVGHQVYMVSGVTYHFHRQNAANSFMPRHYRFIFNGKRLQWLAYYNAGAAVSAHQVFVDGQPMTLRPPAATYYVLFETLDFPDSRPREIDIYTYGLVGGFYCSPIYDFIKPEKSTAPLLFTLGDSYCTTVFTDDGVSSGVQEEVFPALVETYLGLHKNIINGVGGTGFIVRTSSVLNNYVDRLPDLLAANPDILWIPNSSINDLNQRAANAGAPNDATLLAAVRSVLLPYRAQKPNGKIIFGYGHTPPTIFAALKGQMQTFGEVVRAACTDIGVYYVDSTGFLTGTGFATNAIQNVAGWSTTNGSLLVASGTPIAASFVGAPVTGAGIPAGAYVDTVQPTGFNLSVAATATASGLTLGFGYTRRNGNADWAVGSDGVHLTGPGARFLKRRWAEKLKRILIDDGTLLNQVI